MPRRGESELSMLNSAQRLVLQLRGSGLSAQPSLTRVRPTSASLREAFFWVTDCLRARRAKAAVAALRVFMQWSRMPCERVILGPRYSVRLEDVKAADAIDGECVGCGRNWRIAPNRLHDRYQGFLRVQQIRKGRAEVRRARGGTRKQSGRGEVSPLAKLIAPSAGAALAGAPQKRLKAIC